MTKPIGIAFCTYSVIRRELQTLPFLLALLGLAYNSNAQQPPSFPGNTYTDQVGTQLLVNTPSNVAGSYTYTLSSPTWGGAISTPYYNVQVIKAKDSLACGTLQNGTGSIPPLSGKFALIFRGSCEYGYKAYMAQQAGAAGVIIVNNVPGGPVGMGAGATGGMVTIPVLMVSQADGNAINAALNNAQTVNISLTRWATGYAHDVGFVKGGLAQWHAKVIPRSMLSTASDPYKGVIAAYLGNFGTNSLSNVKLKAEINFTPTSGTAATIHSDSVTISSFPTIDSIIAPIAASKFNAWATTTGRFDINYTVSAGTDNNTSNNSATTSFHVSDTIYSKGRYDLVNSRPLSNAGYRYANSSGEVMMGPLYYISHGKHFVKRAQFTVSSLNGDPTLGNVDPVSILLYKWNDGTVTADGIIQANELTIVGEGTKMFSSSDSSGAVFTVPMNSISTWSDPPEVDSNSWYWLAAQFPNNQLFLGCDVSTDDNYYVRSYASANHPTASAQEAYAPAFPGNTWSLGSLGNGSIGMFPFEANNDINDVSFTQQKINYVPAVAMHIFPKILTTESITHACIGMNNGSITITPQTGQAPFQYKLSTSSTYQASNAFSNLPANIYHIDVKDASGNEVQIPVTVKTLVFNTVIAALGDTSFCYGDSVTLKTAYNSMWTYEWQLNGAAIGGATDTVYVAKQNGIYKLIVREQQCSDSSERTILVHTLPTTDAGPASLAITQGNNIILGGNPTAAGNGPFTYSWQPATGLDDATKDNPTSTASANTIYYLSVTDNNGCTGKDSIQLYVFPLNIGNTPETTNIHIYPNPGSDKIHLSGTGVSNGEYTFELRSIAGAVIYRSSRKVANNRIDDDIELAPYANGTYFLIIRHAEHTQMLKIQKIPKLK